MATEKVILADTAKAASDLSSKQFFLVKFDGSGNLILASAATDVAYPLQDNPKLNQHGTYALVGIAKVILGGTVAAGGKVTSDASGKAVAASAGNQVHGIALRAGVSGDVVGILVDHSIA